MLEKIKRIIFDTQTKIIVCAGFGVLFIASSFPTLMSHPVGRRVSTVRDSMATVLPIPLAVGIALLVAAWLIYKKWSTNLKK